MHMREANLDLKGQREQIDKLFEHDREGICYCELGLLQKSAAYSFGASTGACNCVVDLYQAV